MTDFDFPKAFTDIAAAMEHAPFRWQTRLFGMLCRGEIPDALDIPTGLGKTSIMSLWLLALAAGAPLHRRLIYVVDRRTVVDQATDYAKYLRDRLETGASCGYLRKALGLEEHPLPISTLRGQFADNREWLSDVAGSAIIIGTVDMIGSRLLFQGYGVSPTMRSMQAGLLVQDSLLVLDEAHLSRPFQRMVAQLHKLARPASLRAMSLSATQNTDGTIFRLNRDERSDPVVSKRLAARKALTIENPPEAAAKDFATAAWQLAKDHPGERIVVFRENFEEACKIGDNLAKRSGLDVEMLTGQRRGLERDALADRLRAKGFLAGTDGTREHAVVLVATSAGEVGIDLDADHMLCDLVSWERMVQRLGRVNRRGDGAATVAVWDLGKAPGGDDELCRRKQTRTLLERLPGEGEHRQAGPGALSELGKSPEAAKASTPAPLYPPLTMPLVEAWAMTSLPEHAGRPEVGPWLRGWEKNDKPQSKLVWRRYLPVQRGNREIDPAEVKRYLEVAPLRSSEMLEAESHKVLKWMKARAKPLAKSRCGASDQTQPILGSGPVPGDVAALILRADGTFETCLTFADWEAGDKGIWKKIDRCLPGRTVLLCREVAGLDKHGLLDASSNELPLTGDINPETFTDMTTEFVSLEASEEGLDRPDCPGRLGVFLTELGSADEEKSGFAVFRRLQAESESEEARSVRRQAQTLADHTAEVAEWVVGLANRLGLSEDLCQALRLAAEYHDTGKAAGIWQKAAGAVGAEPMAKTTGKGARWNLLQGYRHEFGSLVELEKRGDLPEATRDLILHLVAAHHGRSRPLIASRGCREGPPSQMAVIAGQAAQRFARLSQELGPWRLAWLEAILRAADQQASAAAERKASDG